MVVTPLEARGKFALTVQGEIAALVNQDGDNTMKLGAGARLGRYLTPQLIFAA